MSARAVSKLRIIGGQWRNHHLEFRDLPAIRPTPNRVRETLFNWLAPGIEGAACLDLFAGSGALGFEAVSRGAASANLVDNDPHVCAQIRREIARFGNDAVRVTAADAHAFVCQTDSAYDVVFVDPPFGAGLARTTLELLAKNNHILSPMALIYLEWEAGTPIEPPDTFGFLRQQRAAEVQYGLLQQLP